MIKLLIADDSALMRKCLGEIFKAQGDFDVSFARNGAEALSMAKSLSPDVITLDVNMPVLDGITCLSRIMVECPKPVVMVSSLTSDGAEVTLQALSLGAVDFIPKPDGTVSLHIDQIKVPLVAKVRSAAKAKLRSSRGLLERVRHRAQADTERRRSFATPQRSSLIVSGAGTRPVPPVPGIVLIGVSTGGPGALEIVLPRLPCDFPWPIIIAQHMPESFTGVFARRINDLSELEADPVARRRGLYRAGRCGHLCRHPRRQPHGDLGAAITAIHLAPERRTAGHKRAGSCRSRAASRRHAHRHGR